MTESKHNHIPNVFIYKLNPLKDVPLSIIISILECRQTKKFCAYKIKYVLLN